MMAKPQIVGLSDAAMHMYAAAIDTLPDPSDTEFPDRADVILAGLCKLQDSLADAASRSRMTPSVIVALSGVRSRYDDLMATAANGPAPRWVSASTSRGPGEAVDEGSRQRRRTAQGPHRGRRSRRVGARGRGVEDQGSDRRARRLTPGQISDPARRV